MVCIDEARELAQELVEKGNSPHAILSHLYAAFDGFRFYEHRGKIWAEGEDVYTTPQQLCTLLRRW